MKRRTFFTSAAAVNAAVNLSGYNAVSVQVDTSAATAMPRRPYGDTGEHLRIPILSGASLRFYPALCNRSEATLSKISRVPDDTLKTHHFEHTLFH